MTSFPNRILLATDGSEDAALAARAAADLSARSEAELHVVHVWKPVPSPRFESFVRGQLKEEGEDLLLERVSRVESAGGTVAEAHLREGRPAEEITDLAREIGADLVVVGSRGLGTIKSLFMGSVSEGVVQLAACPVLVMRGGEGTSWPSGRIVVGDDSSEEARAAGDLAARIGGLLGARLLLVRAYLPEILPEVLHEPEGGWDAGGERGEHGKGEMERRADALEPLLGARPEVEIATGDAADVLREVVDESPEPALAAIGSRGLGAVSRLALGSVSTDVLRSVSGPVLIVPPPRRVRR